jgi:predicted nuclease of predicted toxin-antitoxin system
MKFLVDENIGKTIVSYLESSGYDVKWIRRVSPGISDIDVIVLALKENRVIITYDLDFGELVFLDDKKHAGILLLRVSTDLVPIHLKAIKNFLLKHNEKELCNRFWKIGDTYL